MKPRKQPVADIEELIPLLIGQWRRAMQLSGPSDVLQTREFRSVVAEVSSLQEGLFEGDSLFGSDYFASRETLGAYTLYHWLIHYQQGLSLINEIPEVPMRVLDVGAGPCPFAFAALRHGASEVIALDKSLPALEWGAQLCGRYGHPLSICHTDAKRSSLPIKGPFDLIIVAHALREISSSREESLQFLNKLLALLTPEGHLLVVDHSYPNANQHLLALRDSLVDHAIAMRAPCIWRGPCPARDRRDTPCYAQRVMEKPYLLKEIQRAAAIKLSSLKMSYFIACAPGASWPENSHSAPLHRVISPPFEGHHGSTFYLCGSDGKKKLAGTTPLPHEARAFQYLKRGDVIAVEGAVERGNALEISSETALRVVAACGKALV